MNNIKKHEDYEGFVDKFKPKKTTDDCYTPEYIYNAVLSWLKDNADISGKEIIRPFWPGADYQKTNYSDNCIVVDNPPFSILSEIKRYYDKEGVQYFLFSPHLTIFSGYDKNQTYILTGSDIIYHNGAHVNTSFVTNIIDFREYIIIGAPDLKKKIELVQKKYINEKNKSKKKNIYSYPDNLITSTCIDKIIREGIPLYINRDKVIHIKQLDKQKEINQKIFGSGFLCDNTTSERLKAEKLKAERLKADIININLSDQEKKMIENL